jgi:FAD binding domain in molybdopterin dehydrogenase
VPSFAGTHVRNAATVGGNLALARDRRLESDLATVLMGAGATVEFVPLHSCADDSKSQCVSRLLPLLTVYRNRSVHVQCDLQCCQLQSGAAQLSAEQPVEAEQFASVCYISHIIVFYCDGLHTAGVHRLRTSCRSQLMSSFWCWACPSRASRSTTCSGPTR